jgi:hypothetical protein
MCAPCQRNRRTRCADGALFSSRSSFLLCVCALRSLLLPPPLAVVSLGKPASFIRACCVRAFVVPNTHAHRIQILHWHAWYQHSIEIQRNHERRDLAMECASWLAIHCTRRQGFKTGSGGGISWSCIFCNRGSSADCAYLHHSSLQVSFRCILKTKNGDPSAGLLSERAARCPGALHSASSGS